MKKFGNLRLSVAAFLVLMFVAATCPSRPSVANVCPALRVASDLRAIGKTRQAFAEVAAKLERFIAHEMADKGIPAISIALIDDQQIVWQRGFGYADLKAKTLVTPATVFRVGSVSKLFTDIAIMQLAERGELDIDAPVTSYLPNFRPRNPFDKFITLRQLMAHRSGLAREPPVGSYFDSTAPTLARAVESLNRTALVYEPGTRTKYSNAAIALVGYVLERTRREPFARYLKRTVLAPAGMDDSSFEPTPNVRKNLARATMWTIDGRTFDAPTFELGVAPAGSMYATTEDLARFASVLLAGGRGARGSILKPETLAEMWTPQFARPNQKTSFGIGFQLSELEGRRLVGHGGAIYGFSTQLSMLPEERLGVVVISTKDFTNGVTTRIADHALKLMLASRAGQPLPEPETIAPLEPQLARRLAGRYTNGGKGFDLVESAGSLSLLNLDGGFRLRLRAAGSKLIVDDPIAYGIEVTPRGNAIIVGGTTYTRTAVAKPQPPPAAWRGLIGEYGPDHDILYILERDGRLWALIEWFEFNPLTQISANVFAFPDRGLYAGERLAFTRDRAGRATRVEAANVTFERRRVGPEEGARQLRIKPVRSVSELLKEARSARPPDEAGRFRDTDLVELTTLDPTIKLDIRYATTDNFLGTQFYDEPRAFLQRPAAEAVVRVNRKLRGQGYGLLVHDAYRPWYVTKVFWDATPDDKKLFVADPSKGSRHNRGAAIDLTLYDLKTGMPVEMPSTYDEITDRAYPDYPGGTSLQRWHRHLLRDTMEREGFTVYEAEWWHFDYDGWREYRIGNAPFDWRKPPDAK